MTPPRIPPLPLEEFTEEQRQLVGGWHHLNFSRVLIHHPGMYGTFVPWLAKVVAETSLPPRDRQVICLRMLRRCGDVYEHTHHITISRRAGLTDQEIADMSAGEGAALTDHDRLVLRAVEELARDQSVADDTWAALSHCYDRAQMMELVFLAGCYHTMAMLTKSFGMQLETEPEVADALDKLRTYA